MDKVRLKNTYMQRNLNLRFLDQKNDENDAEWVPEAVF